MRAAPAKPSSTPHAHLLPDLARAAPADERDVAGGENLAAAAVDQLHASGDPDDLLDGAEPLRRLGQAEHVGDRKRRIGAKLDGGRAAARGHWIVGDRGGVADMEIA